MKNVVRVTSWISVILALFLIYDLVKEMIGGLSVFEIDLIPFITALIVIANGAVAFLMLTGKLRPQKFLLVLQVFVIIPMTWELYQIFFNSTISCY
ncbi:hypothetical protein ACKW6Q_04630 [Chryseobacterium kwangjuense]|uniref:Uncharacterized protein n=1 Tax=Chryseobacterium kwangjuense TaxID=267125 RepID=A0ABW9JYU6_9FLAO